MDETVIMQTEDSIRVWFVERKGWIVETCAVGKWEISAVTEECQIAQWWYRER